MVLRGNNPGTDGRLQSTPPTAPFNPTSLVGTQGGFWRADMGVTQSSGNVTQWNDQSSNGNNLTVLSSIPVYGTSQTSPTWSSTAFNTSFAGVKLVATTSGLGLATPIFNTTTISWFLLFSLSVGSNSDRLLSEITATSGNDFTTPSLTISDAGGNPSALNFYSSGAQGNGGSNVTITNNVPQVFGGILDGTHGNMYLNFSAVGSATSFSSTVGTSGTGAFTFGFDTTNTSIGGLSAQGVYAYILATNHVCSAGDLSNLKTWTNSNWGTSF